MVIISIVIIIVIITSFNIYLYWNTTPNDLQIVDLPIVDTSIVNNYYTEIDSYYTEIDSKLNIQKEVECEKLENERLEIEIYDTSVITVILCLVIFLLI